MMQSGFQAAPKMTPFAGTPPTTPISILKTKSSRIPSSAATFATPSGMPMPKFTTAPGLSSSAARRAMNLRMPKSRLGIVCNGTLTSPHRPA